MVAGGYIIQRAAGRGYAMTQVRNAILRIGRGTNAQLRSENPAVALEHAIIESDAAGYAVTDRGSITGTYVNGKPVENARLAKGDVLEIGDLRIEVQMADAGKPMILRVLPTVIAAPAVEDEEEQRIAATPGARVVRAKKIDYASAYRLHRPWLTKLSLTAILLIVALGAIGELIRPERQKAFMPGGLSSAHRTARFANGKSVAEDCAACHTPWNSVVNAKCMDCHPRAAHSMIETRSPECFTCHAEHRGMTRLAEISQQECTRCHSDLTPHVKRGAKVEHAKITSFGESHPPLVFPADRNTLRFNHKLHLNAKGIFNAQGRRETLSCKTCHELVTVKEKTDPVAIEFERHCQRCHLLTFDPRFPNDQVPHGGDPNLVYGAVVAAYSGNRDILGRSPTEMRRLLTARQLVTPDARALINAEQVFKTKCQQCHVIARSGTRLTSTPPVIPREWLPEARFSHGKHAAVDCETCHRGVRASVKTSDVLMPALADCTTCHAPNAATKQAGSTCLTCHEYHLRPSDKVVMASAVPAGTAALGTGGRMLQGILLAAIVILLLVVLLPVGLALYQRMRPATPERAPAPRPAPPPPVPDFPSSPTTKIPAITPASIPPPAPSFDQTVIEQTRVEHSTRAENTGGGTEMMQWYGMLVCTSGPIEGQRFIIEDDGFYIGRDSSLSKVVISDSRVSKRHVRVVPRNGKVWAVDQSSTNGTFLGQAGGERITEVQLKRGDTLVLADNAATFVYQI